MKPLYRVLAQLVASQQAASRMGHDNWADKWETALEKLIREHLPSGGGFDAGTTLDLDKSNPDKLVFDTAFHHMNPNGYYDGWTNHTVIVKPSLIHGIDVTVKGRNRNDIKGYILEVFDYALLKEVEG